MELGLFLGVLKEGLRLRNNQQETKWLDRVIKLEKQYYEELSKPEDSRSQLYLDERLHELGIIASNFIKHPGKK